MDIGDPPSNVNRDEIIADSEEEIECVKSLPALSKQPLHTNTVSSISDFTTIAYGARSDDIVSNSIADIAKTRQGTRGTKKLTVVHDDVIELTSEDDVEQGTKSSAQSIKPKPKPKAKMSDKLVPPVTPIASASEQPRPRVRPRPRPIFKQARPKLDSLPPQYPFARDPFVYEIPANPPPLPSTPGQPDLPIATSPVNHAMGIGMTSQLPPSDPPNSTNTTGIGLPPIEILQDGESERDRDSHPLSPSSLFSDNGSRSKTKKRKRGLALDMDNEVDQLIPSSPQRVEVTSHVPLTVLNAYIHGPEPPPTFFAGSSSSAGRYDGNRDPEPSPNPQADVIDLTELTPAIYRANPSKPNKNAKHKVNPEINPTEEHDGDEGSDFKPSGTKTAKKRKGKGKEPVRAKENKPKEKKGRIRKKKEQTDGVVLQAKDKTGKTKEKQTEVFKSREFIDDSGDDLLLVGGIQVEGVPSAKSSPKVDLNRGGLASSSSKSSRSKVDEASSSASAPATEKAKSKGKKRKSIVESDEETSEKGNEIQDKECIVVKRRKPGAVLSDKAELEKDSQENARSGKRKSEGQKSPSSGVSRDDEVEGRSTTSGATPDERTQVRDSKVYIPTNVQKAGKENTSSPSVAAARPVASKAASINSDISTPLYARYEVAPRRSSLPMSELIRRASSKPGSPFPASFTPSHKERNKDKRPDLGAASTTPLATYSPYLKMSRRALSKIAPLHLNRRTPPPPAPAPPPKKKTKKELDREEKWEEELVESVGGIEIWVSMEDSERKQMRRAKMDMEMGGYDE